MGNNLNALQRETGVTISQQTVKLTGHWNGAPTNAGLEGLHTLFQGLQLDGGHTHTQKNIVLNEES